MAGTVALLKGKKSATIGAKKMSERPQRRRSFRGVTVQAGDSLLRAIKAKMLREHGKIDFASLRERGYSQAIISRLKAL